MVRVKYDGRMVAGNSVWAWPYGLCCSLGCLVASMEGDGTVEISPPCSQDMVCCPASYEYRRNSGYSVSLLFLKKVQISGVISGLRLKSPKKPILIGLEFLIFY